MAMSTYHFMIQTLFAARLLYYFTSTKRITKYIFCPKIMDLDIFNQCVIGCRIISFAKI